ncbi:hypothetical protein [Dactylosporangium sp. NPDC049140]|uniref:hypothetical protein n=1 Tax=Dactylosporangium sp. NPDC049140 TaxID=3155647 RepID=UPI0033C705D3
MKINAPRSPGSPPNGRTARDGWDVGTQYLCELACELYRADGNDNGHAKALNEAGLGYAHHHHLDEHHTAIGFLTREL